MKKFVFALLLIIIGSFIMGDMSMLYALLGAGASLLIGIFLLIAYNDHETGQIMNMPYIIRILYLPLNVGLFGFAYAFIFDVVVWVPNLVQVVIGCVFWVISYILELEPSTRVFVFKINSIIGEILVDIILIACLSKPILCIKFKFEPIFTFFYRLLVLIPVGGVGIYMTMITPMHGLEGKQEVIIYGGGVIVGIILTLYGMFKDCIED